MRKILLYPLAFICVICPLCIVARTKPQSDWAKFIKKLSKVCPFCLAYSKIKEHKIS